jgi:hypothetical protein
MSEICIYAGIKGRVGFAAYINYAPIEVNTYFGNSPGTPQTPALPPKNMTIAEPWTT